MNMKKYLTAALGVGVVLTAYDFVAHGQVLNSMYYSKLTSLMRQDAPMHWFIIGDLVAGLVFVWVYDRVYGSFGGGPKAGAMFGLYAGILVTFPGLLFNHLVFANFPYGLAWAMVIVGIIGAIIAGAVAGALYKKYAAFKCSVLNQERGVDEESTPFVFSCKPRVEIRGISCANVLSFWTA
ncbi:MAG: hypothetical protein ACREOO_32740 [bacterium]